MTDMLIMAKVPALYPNHISKPGLLTKTQRPFEGTESCDVCTNFC